MSGQDKPAHVIITQSSDSVVHAEDAHQVHEHIAAAGHSDRKAREPGISKVHGLTCADASEEDQHLGKDERQYSCVKVIGHYRIALYCPALAHEQDRHRSIAKAKKAQQHRFPEDAFAENGLHSHGSLL